LIPILANDSSDTMRVMTASALGDIGDPKAVEPLIATLKDDTMIVRRDAARALGKIGAKNAGAAELVIEPLCEALQDNHSIIQRSAASALAEIGQEHPRLAAGAVPSLIVALNYNYGRRTEIIYALGKIGDRRSVEPLIEHFLTQVDEAQIGEATNWAAWALGEIGDERAVEPLTVLLNTSSCLGVGSAATALGKIGGEQATRSLIARLERQGQRISKRALDLIIGNAEGWFRKDYWDWDMEDLEALMLRTVIEALEMIGTPEALAAFND
jgi:HEAT repeat protein